MQSEVILTRNGGQVMALLSIPEQPAVLRLECSLASLTQRKPVTILSNVSTASMCIRGPT